MADFPSMHDAVPEIDDHHLGYDWTIRERSISEANVVAHFGDLTAAAIDFIDNSPAIVGCVAWLTEERLLTALSRVPVAIIVQKEDFLRPDPGGRASPGAVRRRYNDLSNHFARFAFPSPLGLASYASDPTLDPVRCVGNHNSSHSPAMPRMHHKFLVRIEETYSEDDGVGVRALAVWTGSFNFSYNGGRSFENAVEIHDPNIAQRSSRSSLALPPCRSRSTGPPRGSNLNGEWEPRRTHLSGCDVRRVSSDELGLG